jgi:hypothetical protein
LRNDAGAGQEKEEVIIVIMDFCSSLLDDQDEHTSRRISAPASLTIKTNTQAEGFEL